MTARKTVDVLYEHVTSIAWDHANSEVKINVTRTEEEDYVILTMQNSIELEGELRLRFSNITVKGIRMPSIMYIGMFAGATKPKPFQRKRPNISSIASSKLPSLHDMRDLALKLHNGSYKPCPPGESRRLELALQHIYEGFNSFALLNVRGNPSIANQWRYESVLLLMDEMMVFKPGGIVSGGQQIEYRYEDIAEWNALDNENIAPGNSGVEIRSHGGDTVFFGLQYIRDFKHTLEYFWNKYQIANGRRVKLGSTHGRPIVSVATLSGESPSPEAPVGQSDVIDQDGTVVRAGTKLAPRRASVSESFLGSKNEPIIVPSENKKVKKHWHQIVMHQGWLLKQGGIGIGQNKAWIKRYFVLYKTSQGHFLVYYSDFTECPLYTTEKNHRNIVDLAKATFIRPGSTKGSSSETPPNSFDIVTTEREWTLCAETQENVAKWLKLITRAVDEDVAILPDEDLLFNVKAKSQPSNVLPATDYTTVLKVSANGVSVSVPDQKGIERQIMMWIYTDFYKWSLVSKNGKLALSINVFSDASFSRRDEYEFRHKEAVRLATAIEYYIEKFMSVMHVRLETMEGVALDDEEAGKTGLHVVDTNEWRDDDEVVPDAPVAELDLLGLDSPSPAATNSADPFGDNPFGGTTTAKSVSSSNPSAVADPFGDDPFGSSDPFGMSEAPVVAGPKLAPPLTAAQIVQHKKWYQNVTQMKSGPLYDDGVLQIALKVEVKASQARVTFMYRNQSPATLSAFDLSIEDGSGLIRFQFSPYSNEISSLASGQITLMVECMKPASPGPNIKISYVDSLMGKRDNTINLPISVTTFNEQLSLNATDFMAKWQQLSQPGLEGQQVFNVSYPINANSMKQALTTALQFGEVVGVTGGSDTVLFGAATLRTGASTPTGEKVSIGCLVKLEINLQANALRVTTRTLHPAATQALLATVKTLLA